MIELSANDPGTAFVPVHRYRLDDFTPYVYRTDDYGRNWTRLPLKGIPKNHFVRVIREDPLRKGLLYIGTEFGLYISHDDGDNWQSFQLNLPVVQIADMAIKDDDLVVATHGRAFWVLDDISQMRDVDRDILESEHYLFDSKDAYRRIEMVDGRNPLMGPTEFGRKDWSDLTGLTLYYHLASIVDEEVTIEILEMDGDVIHRYSSQADEISTNRGMNKFFWDLRYPTANLVGDKLFRGGNYGPQAVPAVYQVRLTVGDWSQTRKFNVQQDPRIRTSKDDLQQQFNLAIEIRDSISRLNDDVRRIAGIRRQLRETAALNLQHKARDSIISAINGLEFDLRKLELSLVQEGVKNPLEASLLMPSLEGQLVQVLNIVLSSEHRPTDGAIQRFTDLNTELKFHHQQLSKLVNDGIRSLNILMAKENLPAVVVDM